VILLTLTLTPILTPAGLVQTLFIMVTSLPLVRGYAARQQAKIVVMTYML
jgi:hypothetical protein